MARTAATKRPSRTQQRAGDTDRAEVADASAEAELLGDDTHIDPGSSATRITVSGNATLDLSQGTVKPPEPVAGENAVLSWTVTNLGPDDVTSAVGEFDMGEGLSEVGCTIDDKPAPEYQLPPLKRGEKAVVALTVQIAPNAGIPLGVLFGVHNADATPSRQTIVVPVSKVDLSLTGDPTGETVAAGQPVSFRWKVENRGPSSAEMVSVRATLPAGVRFDSADGGGTLQADGTVLWQLGYLDPPRSRTVTVKAKTSPNARDTLVATAMTTFSRPDGSGSPATTPRVPVTLKVQELATLTCTAAAVPQRAVAGRDELTCTWTFHNEGPAVVRGLAVTATLPDGLAFVSATEGGALQKGGSVSWALPPVECGDTTVAVTAKVDPGALGPLTATAKASATTLDATTKRPIRLPATEVTVTATAEAVLSLRAETTDPPRVVAGDRDHPADFRWTLTNKGSSTATGVTARVTLPPGATFVSATPTATINGKDISWDLGTLPPDHPADLTLRAWPAPEVRDSLTLKAGADARTLDPRTGKPARTPEAPATVQVTVKAQLRVVETRFSPETVQDGDQLALAWHVVNTGPSLARNVTRTVKLPSALHLADGQQPSYTQMELAPGKAGGWFTVVTTVGGTRDEKLTTTGLFTGDGSTEVCQDITVPVKQGMGGFHFPSGFVPFGFPPPFGGDGTGEDHDESDDDDDEKDKTTTLKFTKAKADPETIDPGDPVTYSWTLKNTGRKVTAKNIYVSITLPTDVKPKKVDGLPAAPTPKVIVGYLGSLAPGKTQDFSVETVVDDGATGSLPARAYACSAQAFPLWKTAEATARASSQLDLIGEVASNPTDSGKPITYRWTLTNKGPSDTSGLTVRIAMPDQVSDPTGKVTKGGSQTATWDERNRQLVLDSLGTLSKDQQLTFEATATVRSDVTGPLEATAHARATDAPEVKNTLTAEVKAALGLTGTAVPPEVVAGRDLTYVWTLTHAGGPSAEKIDLTVGLPASLTYRTSSHSGAPAPDGRKVQWPRIDRLGPGEQRTVTVTALVDPAAKADTIPAVTATAKARDTADATGKTDAVRVTRTSALTIDGTGTPSPVTVGEPASLVWTVVNRGPSLASGAVAALTLPPELGSPKITVSNGRKTSGQAGSTPLPDLKPGLPVTVTATGTTTTDGLAQARGTVRGRAVVTENGQAAADAVARIEIDSDAVLALTPGPDTADLRTADAGTTVPFTWTVARAGTCATGPASLRIALPPELTATEALVDGQAASSLSQSDGHLTLGLDGLSTGKQTVRVTCRVSPQAPAAPAKGPDPLAVTALLFADGASPVTHTARLNVTVRSTVRISAFQLPYPVTAGGESVLVWSLGNDGPSSARDTSFVLTLPKDLVFLDATVDTAPRSGTVDPAHPGRRTVPVGELAPGEAAQIAVRVTVSPDPAGPKAAVTRSATVGSTTGLASGSDPVPIGSTAQVAITTTVSPPAPLVGDNVTYVWNLTNTGQSTVRGATFEVTVTGEEFVPDHGSTVAKVTPSEDGKSLTVVFVVPALAPVAEQTFTLVGKATKAVILVATPVVKDGTGKALQPPGPEKRTQVGRITTTPRTTRTSRTAPRPTDAKPRRAAAKRTTPAKRTAAPAGRRKRLPAS
ncbi:hypothetical protein ACFVXH_18055 [Kitasatospora sp. NPDC058184]|uniref:hypothetical protein n=1 Tax=Kitasatospora sp. NPDC058184 TaxID=3346370 RepID=UPI0036DD6B1D